MEPTCKKRLTAAMSVAFALLSVSTMVAQVLHEQDLLLNPADLLGDPYLGNGNGAYIQQIGNANEIDLYQVENGPQQGNLARLLQSGNENLALIQQNGQGNQLALIQQGNLNLYELVNDGNGNRLVAIQQGSNNTIIQELIQSNQIYSEMIQIGNGNEIITVLENLNNRDFQIRQVGDGLRAVIRQSGN